MFNVILLVGLVIWLFYKFWTASYSYWKKRNFPFIPGKFPFGSKPNLLLLKSYQGYTFMEIYDELAPHPYGGIYQLRTPILFLRDPEIIKFVMTKEFNSFKGRTPFKRTYSEPLAQHLFNIEGDKWRALRVKLTPTFTTGKLKNMFLYFVTCCEALDSLLLTKLDGKVDVKDITSRFTLDIIGTCAFGLEINAIENSDSKFKEVAFSLFKKNLFLILKIALLNAFPEMSTYWMPRFTTKSLEEFFMTVVKDTVEYREKQGIQRNDFLSLLMELKEKDLDVDSDGKTLEMTTELMTAQCFVFFAAGFETSSSVQSYCFYELALHPEIQDRLRTEIDKTVEAHGGVTYQAVQEMQYLDMVVSETLRKYPTLPLLTRRCTTKTELPGGQTVEEGMRIFIPVYALHHSPQYFPKPEKFDPERFSPENRASIVPYTYLPFGEGPRNCIGMRFGMLQTKMGVITVLRKYQIEVTDETMIPLKLIGSTLTTTTEGPIILKFTARK